MLAEVVPSCWCQFDMNHIFVQLIVVCNYTKCTYNFHAISKHQPHAFLCVQCFDAPFSPEFYKRHQQNMAVFFYVVQQHMILNGIVTFNCF